VLKDDQVKLRQQSGRRRTIRCLFSESDPYAYRRFVEAVEPFNSPADSFEIKTYFGKFEDAVPSINSYIGTSFPLIFIDPTGWTGYPFTKIGPLFSGRRCEVLINFMYGFISRFVTHPDENVINSLNPILGGPGWQKRLDDKLTPGAGVEKLFRETLKSSGKFKHVVSTRIEQSTADRPHFFLAYGTKNRAGLITFRDIEYKALREHARNRTAAKGRKSGIGDLFEDFEADVQEASIDVLVERHKKLATAYLLRMLSDGQGRQFSAIVDELLEVFMLRETNVKDVCVDLSRLNLVVNTWSPSARKPTAECTIRLV
ncbi:MAG: three-Cys-motif partner protein TcmP, partial [Caulobacteraceae bacterium]